MEWFVKMLNKLVTAVDAEGENIIFVWILAVLIVI